MKIMENKYGNNDAFKNARASLEEMSREVELGVEREVIGCYGKHLDQLDETLSDLATDQIEKRYAQLKSDLFATSMAFFTSISERLTLFERRVWARLRGLPLELKTQLLSYWRDWWIEKVYPMLQEFVDRLDRIAKRLHVDTYSVSLNYGPIGVEFTFKPTP